MNQPSNEDEALTALLPADSRSLSDDGFTAQVLAALPRRRQPAPRWPWFAYVGGTTAGTLFALWRGLAQADAPAGLSQLAESLRIVAVVLTGPWLLVSLVTVAFALVVAFTPSWLARMR